LKRNVRTLLILDEMTTKFSREKVSELTTKLATLVNPAPEVSYFDSSTEFVKNSQKTADAEDEKFNPPGFPLPPIRPSLVSQRKSTRRTQQELARDMSSIVAQQQLVPSKDYALIEWPKKVKSFLPLRQGQYNAECILEFLKQNPPENRRCMAPEVFEALCCAVNRTKELNSDVRAIFKLLLGSWIQRHHSKTDKNPYFKDVNANEDRWTIDSIILDTNNAAEKYWKYLDAKDLKDDAERLKKELEEIKMRREDAASKKRKSPTGGATEDQGASKARKAEVTSTAGQQSRKPAEDDDDSGQERSSSSTSSSSGSSSTSFASSSSSSSDKQ